MKELAVAYARVSSRSDNQLNSIENQKIYFEKEIANQKNIRLIHVFADTKTGRSLRRPQFDEMLQRAGLKFENKWIATNKEPEFQWIFIKDTSRFARNSMSWDIINTLREKKVYIYFCQQGISTKDITGDLTIKILQIMDESESTLRSSKVKFGLDMAKKQGKVRSNHNIYGFTYENGELKKNEKEAKIIEEAFDLYVNYNMGFRKICQIFDKKNYTTRSGSKWQENTLTRMFQNEKLYGGNNNLKWEALGLDKKQRKIRPDYEAPITNNIDEIIPFDTWKKANDILKERTKGTKGLNRGKGEWAGKLICGHCGKSYIRNSTPSRGDGRVWFVCSDKKNRTQEVCSSKNVQMWQFEELLSKFENKEYNQAMYYDLHKIYNRGLLIKSVLLKKQFQYEELLKDLDATDNAISELNLAIINVNDRLNRGKISEEMYDNFIEEYETELIQKIEYRKHLDDKPLQVREYLLKLDDFLVKYEACNKIMLDKQYTRKDIHEIIFYTNENIVTPKFYTYDYHELSKDANDLINNISKI